MRHHVDTLGIAANFNENLQLYAFNVIFTLQILRADLDPLIDTPVSEEQHSTIITME